MPQPEYEAAIESRQFDALNPQSAILISEALLELGRDRDAAQALLEGRLYSNDRDLDSAFQSLYRIHSEYFDLPAQCLALQNARKRASDAGKKVRAGELAARCEALSSSAGR